MSLTLTNKDFTEAQTLKNRMLTLLTLVTPDHIKEFIFETFVADIDNRHLQIPQIAVTD